MIIIVVMASKCILMPVYYPPLMFLAFSLMFSDTFSRLISLFSVKPAQEPHVTETN